MDQSGMHNSFTIEEIETSVIEFLKMIDNLTRTPSSLEDLADGFILTELLAKISSTQFDLESIERETDGNWALNHKNITSLVRSIEAYYRDTLKTNDLDAEAYMDIMEISQSKSKLEIVKLVELVLGVIVQSEQKTEFIHAITQLERKAQAILMHLMEKWIVHGGHNSHHSNGNNNSISGSGIDHLGGANGTMMHNDDAYSVESLNSSRMSASGIHFNHAQSYQQNLQQQAIILRKVDELERDNDILNDKMESLRGELIERDRRIEEYEREVTAKDDEIKKLKLAKDSLMLSLGMNLTDDSIEGIVRDKDLKIEQMNQLVSGLQAQAAEEKSKLEDEIALLGKKLKQFQKSSESLEFYKEKYTEFSQLQEKFAEADKKVKSFDKVLSEKDAQVEMLMEKLAEFKNSYQEERKKAMGKAIEVTEKESIIESLRRENDTLEQKYHIQEEKLQDISQTLERMQHDDSLISNSFSAAATTTGTGAKGSDQQLRIAHERQSSQQAPKGLHEDLSELIDDLQRENLLLKHEQNSTVNVMDVSQLNLDDAASLKESIELLQKKLEVISREKHELEGKVAAYAKLDVQRITEENEKLKADYHALLAKGVSRKERLVLAENVEDQVRQMQEELANRETEFERVLSEEKSAKEILKRELVGKYENQIQQLDFKVAQMEQEIVAQNSAKDVVEKKLKAQNQGFKDLFQSKNEELEILYSVLCEMRQKYQQAVTQKNRSALFS